MTLDILPACVNATRGSYLQESKRIVVIGAGIGGLATAIELARRGLTVDVLEAATVPGGKLREVEVAGRRLDAGPTVLTMRAVFDALLEAGGERLGPALCRATVLARHYWPDGSSLDLHADAAASTDAIGRFAGSDEADRFTAFMARARRSARLLEAAFLREPRPTALGVALATARHHPADLLQLNPFATLWDAVCGGFRDARLRQLFARYATYCGSSPYLAPATLGMIAQVEADGVWLLPQGLYGLAQALERSARALGVQFRYGCRVTQLDVDRGRVAGLRLATGERLGARQVIFNGDTAALSAGLLGGAARPAVPARPQAQRSLSAVTWNLVARTGGAPLAHHTICFSADYAREFSELIAARTVPTEPTVYVCAQDRDSTGHRTGSGAERLLCLVNAPATGDRTAYPSSEVAACESKMRRQLERCGLALQDPPEGCLVTTPADFERLYPRSGGALYGSATHGWRAAFSRPRARTRIRGLYLAGGSVHPGAGMPMAALSGLHAAACVMQDLDSSSRSATTAMRGGTWTRWATIRHRD